MASEKNFFPHITENLLTGSSFGEKANKKTSPYILFPKRKTEEISFLSERRCSLRSIEKGEQYLFGISKQISPKLSDNKLFSPFSSSFCDYASSTWCLHSFAKPMSAFPVQFFRLIRSFHIEIKMTENLYSTQSLTRREKKSTEKWLYEKVTEKIFRKYFLLSTDYPQSIFTRKEALLY